MATNTPMLEVSQIVVHYGGICALDHVSLHVEQGEIVSVIGANGAGKSTLMRTICAVKAFTSGEIKFKGQALKKDASHVVRQGMTLVPEGRRIFAPLSVHENLMLGAYTRTDKKEILETMEEVFQLFPRLQERLYQRGGTLSGGEQQMLAVSRALMSKPEILLLDEPSLGLAPIVIDNMFETIRRLNREFGLTILIVEQNATLALEMCDRAYVLETGQIRMEGRGSDLLHDERVMESYLGITK
ncbi:MAG TPA: ABC transporter ATP-binding protein [Anaerolineales bacterium]|nr:ABC transporter ATP-binding protein [Anaerolineales bacterium]